MISFRKHTLSNGLRVIVCPSPLTSVAVFNMFYRVGARAENENRTGFAHLFEHLMFGGSANVNDFDYEVGRVGGDNNAYTTNDFTNYYMTMPADNIETAFWLESDRLLAPTLSHQTLDVQRKVVVEEFTQNYLNRPYGDITHHARDLAYKVHPYRWPTIGLRPQHILDASLQEVRDFFFANYTPDNAVLSVVGNVDADHIFALAEKWFADINRTAVGINPPAEPLQTEARRKVVYASVPSDKIEIMYHVGSRFSSEFYLADVMTDILADGESCRFVQDFVRGSRTCVNVDAHTTGAVDPGLLTLSATLADGVKPEDVEAKLLEHIHRFATDGPTPHEMQKVFNRIESSAVMSEISAQNIAERICFYEAFGGNAELINSEIETYRSITADQLKDFARNICRPENSNTLFYLAKKD